MHDGSVNEGSHPLLYTAIVNTAVVYADDGIVNDGSGISLFLLLSIYPAILSKWKYVKTYLNK